jgi:hypothetical protein
MILSRSPCCDIAIGLRKERRRNVAAVRREAAEKAELGRPDRRPTERIAFFRPAYATGERERAKIAAFSRSTGLLLHVGRLTIAAAEDYIDPLGRAAA